MWLRYVDREKWRFTILESNKFDALSHEVTIVLLESKYGNEKKNKMLTTIISQRFGKLLSWNCHTTGGRTLSAMHFYSAENSVPLKVCTNGPNLRTAEVDLEAELILRRAELNKALQLWSSSTHYALNRWFTDFFMARTPKVTLTMLACHLYGSSSDSQTFMTPSLIYIRLRTPI